MTASAPPVLVGRDGDRKGNPAPLLAPFYSKGGTWRGAWWLPEPGWYWVDEQLHGPYGSRNSAAVEMVVQVMRAAG